MEEAEEQIKPVIEAEEIFILADANRTFGEIKLAQGDEKTAEEFIQESLRLAREQKDSYMEGYAQRALGKVKLIQGIAEEARNAFGRAIQCVELCGV